MTIQFTAFQGVNLLASGPLAEVTLAVLGAHSRSAASIDTPPILVFDDTTGRVVDMDPRQSTPRQMPQAETPLALAPELPRAVGRPKLGVVAREVTLLPRHWDWLNGQPGGASVALRKLVEQARRDSGGHQRHRQAQEAAYHFMRTMAGDLPGYEEALRSLFADDRRAFADRIAAWPADVRDHAVKLAFADLEREVPAQRA